MSISKQNKNLIKHLYNDSKDKNLKIINLDELQLEQEYTEIKTTIKDQQKNNTLNPLEAN